MEKSDFTKEVTKLQLELHRVKKEASKALQDVDQLKKVAMTEMNRVVKPPQVDPNGKKALYGKLVEGDDELMDSYLKRMMGSSE